MAEKFIRKRFSDIHLDDPFFDSLKADYPGTSASTGFVNWFDRKSREGKEAFVFEDESNLIIRRRMTLSRMNAKF